MVYENKNPNYFDNAALLSIISAAFALIAGVIGIATYQSYIDYLVYYGVDASDAIWFLMIAGISFASSAIGFIGAAFCFMKKRFIIPFIGSILMLASGFSNIFVEWHFKLGYSDSLMVSAILLIVLPAVIVIMLLKSQKPSPDNASVTQQSPELTSVDESVFKD